MHALLDNFIWYSHLRWFFRNHFLCCFTSDQFLLIHVSLNHETQFLHGQAFRLKLTIFYMANNFPPFGISPADSGNKYAPVFWADNGEDSTSPICRLWVPWRSPIPSLWREIMYFMFYVSWKATDHRQSKLYHRADICASLPPSNHVGICLGLSIPLDLSFQWFPTDHFGLMQVGEKVGYGMNPCIWRRTMGARIAETKWKKLKTIFGGTSLGSEFGWVESGNT